MTSARRRVSTAIGPRRAFFVRWGGFFSFLTALGLWWCGQATLVFPRVTAHDLRHTAASLAISAGANVKVVQRMLGHKSAAMTLDTYADLFDDDLTGLADKLDGSVGKMWAPAAAMDA